MEKLQLGHGKNIKKKADNIKIERKANVPGLTSKEHANQAGSLLEYLCHLIG